MKNPAKNDRLSLKILNIIKYIQLYLWGCVCLPGNVFSNLKPLHIQSQELK